MMRIDGATTAAIADRGHSSPGNPRTGALIALNPGEGRKGFAASFPHIPAGEYLVVHDEVRGAVVIDLFLAALRFDESPGYRLTGQGTVEIGRKPRKGGILDLRA